MDNRRNYYRILHVQPGAPTEIIRASYRTLMQRLRAHPDLGGDHWNATVINEAYSVLSDPLKRARYDRSSTRTSSRCAAKPLPTLCPNGKRTAAQSSAVCSATHRTACGHAGPADYCA